MTIKFLLEEGEAIKSAKILKNLILISGSLCESGIDSRISLNNQQKDDNGEEFFITVGNASVNCEILNIPLSADLKEISEKVFNAAGNILFGGCTQITVKLFGDRERIKSKINGIDIKQGIGLFLYSQGLVSTLKIIMSVNGEESGAVSDIFSALKKNIYAEEDVKLDYRLLELLKLRNKKISVAESLTGGLIASRLIDNAGASECFFEGLVAYSNDSKIQRLNIDGKIIKEFGAVSFETAYEMAAGLLSSDMCDIALATTGIAGPSGGTASKPVGLTFIAVGTKDGIHVYKHIFQGDRSAVREAASEAAMFYAIKILKDGGFDYEELQIN